MVTDFHLAGLAQAMSDQMKAKHLAQPRMLAFAAPSYLPTSYSSKGPYAPFAMQSISQMHSLSGVKAMSSYSTLPPPQHYPDYCNYAPQSASSGDCCRSKDAPSTPENMIIAVRGRRSDYTYLFRTVAIEQLEPFVPGIRQSPTIKRVHDTTNLAVVPCLRIIM